MKTVEVKSLEELIKLTPRKVKLIFVADVGATNTRVSFVPIQLATHTLLFFKARASSVPDMLRLFKETEARATSEITSRVVAAAVAVPGPVTENGSVAVVANFEAKDTAGRTIRVADFPTKLCPMGRTRLLNDLHACAAGIAGLSHIGAFGAAFKRMWGPAAKADASNNNSGNGDAPVSLGKGSVVVLAPGTGLGSALLHFDADSDRFIVVPLEFGHTHISTFKHPALMASLVSTLGRGNHPVEFDDVCTGRGLEHIFKLTQSSAIGAKTDGSGTVSAPLISRAAASGDMDATMAFTIKYGLLMNLASQLSMGFVPDTVVIAGDNAVRHKFFLGDTRHAAQLKAEFLSHTMERLGFMSRVQVVRQDVEMNLNLIGAAFAASQQVERSAAPQSKL